MFLPSKNQLFLNRILTGFSLAALLLFAAPAVSADRAQKYHDKGVTLHQQGNLDGALVEFSEGLKLVPKDASFLRWIGYIHLEKRNYESAKEFLEKAVLADPKSVVAHLNLGTAYDGLKMYTKALEEFQTVTRLMPNNADAYYNMGVVYSKTNRSKEAADAYKMAAKLEAEASTRRPTQPKNTRSNVPKSVETAISRPRKEDPVIHASLGESLLDRGEYKDAITSYQKAVELAPTNGEYHLQLATAWRKAGAAGQVPKDQATTNARRSTKAAYDNAQNNYEAVELYGELLFEQGNNNEAANLFEKAHNLDKKQFNAAYNLGVARFKQGRFADAEKAYAAAHENADPTTNPKGRYNAQSGLASAQLKQNKYAEAAENFKALTMQMPENVDTWLQLAMCYKASKNEAGEVEALKGAVTNSGDAPSAKMAPVHASLGAIHLRKGEYQQALDHYVIADRGRPNHAETYNAMAICEQKLKNVEESILLLNKALLISPRYADAYNNRGVSFEARYAISKDKKDLDKALDNYKKALEINPDHPAAKKNKARFDALKKK